MYTYIHTEECPTIRHLLRVMRNEFLAIKWYELGVELLPPNKNKVLQVIKADHPNDVNACCHKMLQTWLNMKPDASWGQLVAALEEIGLGSAANAVSSQYIPGTYVQPLMITCYHV